MVSRSRRNRANAGENGPGNTSALPGSSMSNQRKGRQEKEQTDALKELTKQVKVLIDTVKVSQRRGGGIASGGTGPSSGAGPMSGGAPGAMAGGGMMRGAMGLMGGPAGMGMMGIQMAMMLPFLFQGGASGGQDQSDQSLGQLSETADKLTTRLDEVVVQMGNLAKSTGSGDGQHLRDVCCCDDPGKPGLLPGSRGHGTAPGERRWRNDVRQRGPGLCHWYCNAWTEPNADDDDDAGCNVPVNR